MENYLRLFEVNPPAALLILAIFVDILSGILAAGKEGKLASAIAFDKMYSKLAILLIPFSARIVEALVAESFGQSWPVGGTVTSYYIIVEVMSILENMGRLGAPLPKFLLSALAVMREKLDQGPAEPPPVVTTTVAVAVPATAPSVTPIVTVTKETTPGPVEPKSETDQPPATTEGA